MFLVEPKVEMSLFMDELSQSTEWIFGELMAPRIRLARIRLDERKGSTDSIFRRPISRFRWHEIANPLSGDDVGWFFRIRFDFLSQPT